MLYHFYFTSGSGFEQYRVTFDKTPPGVDEKLFESNQIDLKDDEFQPIIGVICVEDIVIEKNLDLVENKNSENNEA